MNNKTNQLVYTYYFIEGYTIIMTFVINYYGTMDLNI
jgi:hypothetical protein